MADIRIPFMERFHRPLVLDIKSATSRSKRYGRIGDQFPLEVHFADGCPAHEVLFHPGVEPVIAYCGNLMPHLHRWELITDPAKIHLGTILDYLFDIEGFDGPEEAWEVWREIHPRRQWTGSEQVFLHRFRRIR